MKEIEVGKNKFRIDKIDAINQLHIARRLMKPVSEAFIKIQCLKSTNEDATILICDAFSKMSDEETNYCLFGLLSVVSIKDAGGTSWSNISDQSNYSMQYQNISYIDLIKIAWEVLSYNGFYDFFLEKLENLPEESLNQSAQ